MLIAMENYMHLGCELGLVLYSVDNFSVGRGGLKYVKPHRCFGENRE